MVWLVSHFRAHSSNSLYSHIWFQQITLVKDNAGTESNTTVLTFAQICLDSLLNTFKVRISSSVQTVESSQPMNLTLILPTKYFLLRQLMAIRPNDLFKAPDYDHSSEIIRTDVWDKSCIVRDFHENSQMAFSIGEIKNLTNCLGNIFL